MHGAGSKAVGIVDDHHVREVRKIVAHRGDPLEVREVLHEHHLRARVVHEVSDLVGRRRVVDRDRGAAEQQHRDVGDVELGPVPDQHGDPRAAPDPEVGQGGGHPGRSVSVFGVGERSVLGAVLPPQRHRPRMLLDRGPEQARDGLTGHDLVDLRSIHLRPGSSGGVIHSPRWRTCGQGWKSSADWWILSRSPSRGERWGARCGNVPGSFSTPHLLGTYCVSRRTRSGPPAHSDSTVWPNRPMFPHAPPRAAPLGGRRPRRRPRRDQWSRDRDLCRRPRRPARHRRGCGSARLDRSRHRRGVPCARDPGVPQQRRCSPS